MEILFNAKTSRPSVCNAAESLLVHREIAEEFLPLAKQKLDTKGVVWYGCEETRRILGESVLPAGDEEYAKEFLGLTPSPAGWWIPGDAAFIFYKILHQTLRSHRDRKLYRRAGIYPACGAAAVYVNASTALPAVASRSRPARSHLHAELHARGPMGLEELTSSNMGINGNGRIPYSGTDQSVFPRNEKKSADGGFASKNSYRFMCSKPPGTVFASLENHPQNP